ncbi:MAG: galactose oxidase-like domain-containing protein [Candidatus Eisenbacteria bacterium]
MLPPRPGHVPWARLTQPRAIVSLLLLAGQVLPPVQASAYTLSQTGRWTPTQAWEQTPVHLMLLRGTGAPSHSTVLWWVGTGQHEQFYGGLWGWRAGSYDCSTYPDTSVLKRLPFDLPGAASLFCAGHSQLADGKAFLSGGTQPGTEFGIRTTYTFTAGADSNQAWLERDSLESARWYPAATTLASGDALVTSGSHFQHLHFFGGLKDSESAPTDSAVFRYGIGEGGVSQEPVRTSSSPIWPSPREGHSSVYYSYGGPTRIFGGKLQDGRYSQEVWQMRREQNPAAADYDYDWERVTPDASPPARWRHIAVNTEQAAAPMLLFGGILKNGLGQDEAANDVWRYWFQTGVGYTWSAVNITNPTSSDAPGARNGHVALWHQPSRSTLVFGGRSTPTGNPTDSALYRLAFSTDMTSATWSKLTATGPGPRAEMALAYNTAWTNGPATFAFTFGGNLASGKSKQLWELKLGADPDTARWREITYLGGTPPSPRSGHTLLADGGNRWLYLFGGTSPAGSDDDTVYVARLDSLKMLLGELRQWAPYARHSVSLTGHTAVFEDGAIFARKPELYSPGTNSWSTLSSPRLQEWYPQAFVLKSDTVYFAGPDVFGRKLALSTGNWSVFPQDSTAGFKGGTSVMYRPGKIMKAGSRDGSSGAASGTTRSVDLTAGTGAYWRASSNSMAPRVNHNLVILPNGQVLATGGTSSLGNDNNSSAEFRPELWDPDYGSGAGQWNGLGVLDSMPTLRDYHSTALLLPDGRVLTGGGNSDKQTRGSAEIYCPPYLYGGDTLAVRPTLLATTGRWRYGAGVTIAVSGDTTIRRACLIHPGSVTHGHDQAQRYVPLTLQSSAVRDDGVRQYFLSAPPDSFIAPPGDYLLFVSNSGGVPSIAQWVRVGATESGQYDTTAPDTLSLAAEFITCDGIYPLTWAAPGDNAAAGTALDFDVRYSTSAITEGNFQSATQVTGLPIPHLAGTIQQGDDLTSLQTCTHYYFAAKTRDRAGNWSALGRVKYKTLCVGGSCGGGGLSMSRSREDAA